MSTLSGQTIQSTYQGLLKLSNSTTGITSSLQSIEDGLGGNTGIRIATDQIESPNIQSFIPLMGRYYGPGYNSTNTIAWPTGSQGEIYAIPFIDKGDYEYSAMTVNMLTATTVSDTIDAAFYTSQIINPNGLYPHAVVLSGFSITTTGSTGTKTITFPSNLSFSGYGGGVYWLVFKFTSANNPNVRYGTTGVVLTAAQTVPIYGLFQSSPTTDRSFKLNSNSAAGVQYFSGQTTFDNPFANNLDTLQSSSLSFPLSIGFLLHTVGA